MYMSEEEIKERLLDLKNHISTGKESKYCYIDYIKAIERNIRIT